MHCMYSTENQGKHQLQLYQINQLQNKFAAKALGIIFIRQFREIVWNKKKSKWRVVIFLLSDTFSPPLCWLGPDGGAFVDLAAVINNCLSVVISRLSLPVLAPFLRAILCRRMLLVVSKLSRLNVGFLFDGPYVCVYITRILIWMDIRIYFVGCAGRDGTVSLRISPNNVPRLPD